MIYKQQAQELVAQLHQHLSPSPYDIAWMAGIHVDKEPRWPTLLDWLIANQHDDGSWGSAITYYHDRIICTITAVNTLQQHIHTPAVKNAIVRAEDYIWHHLHLLHRDPSDLVGFELLFPTLLTSARQAGSRVPTHTCGYGKIQSEKLRLIPPDLLYSPKVSIVHSLEFLGDHGDLNRLKQAMNPINGSLGNSPATSAYLFQLLQENGNADSDPSSLLAYLEEVYQRSQTSMVVYPFATFETTWVLNNLWFSGVTLNEFAPTAVFDKLHNEIIPHGIGADATFGIPDGDSTAVCYKLLTSVGDNLDPHILSQYQDKEAHLFRTYQFERNPSISTNAHALETLLHIGNYPDKQETVKNITLMLLDKRRHDIYWTDKWHISPYYATSHILVALLASDDKFIVANCKTTIEWLINTQYKDGSWGFFLQGTLEETAYVLTALLHYHQYAPIDTDTLHRGAAYLAEMYESEPDYPPMWIEKCLYAPYDIIKSAILSTLILHEEMFGKIA